jgi:hypothetical protein
MKFLPIFLLFFTFGLLSTSAQDTLKNPKYKKKAGYIALSTHTNFLTSEQLRETYKLKSFNHFGIGFIAGENDGKVFVNMSYADFRTDSLGNAGTTTLRFLYASTGYVRHTYFHQNIGLRNRIGAQLCIGNNGSSFGYIASIGLIIRNNKQREVTFFDFGYNRQRTLPNYQSNIRDLSCFVFSTGVLF